MRIYKIFLFFIIFHSTLPGLKAQTIASDFTLIDINGKSHHLYEYLDSGKTVLLDLFATWCEPCWSISQEKILNDLYLTYGPNGTNELIVISVEGDLSTDMDDLLGLGNNTYGNFVTDTDYPICNPYELPYSFLDVYSQDGFPTISVICPDKYIYADVFDEDFAGMLDELMTCNTISTINDVIISQIEGEKSTCDTIYPKVSIRNSGSFPITSIKLMAKDSIGLLIDSIDAYCSAQTGDQFVVELSPMPLMHAKQHITFTLQHEDAVLANNVKTATYELGQESIAPLLFHIHADPYTLNDNLRFHILNGFQEVVYSSNPFAPNEVTELVIDLYDPDCYTFQITDDYGDGNFGEIWLKDANNEILFNKNNFGQNANAYFTLKNETTKIQTPLNETKPSIYPNPTEGFCTINVNGKDGLLKHLSIIDMKGNQVYQKHLNIFRDEHIHFDVSFLKSGIYQIVLISSDQIWKEKLVISPR